MSAVSLDDLELALIWVSAPDSFGNAAYVSKETGDIFYASTSQDLEEKPPDDVDDPDRYWSVPHKNDLELGRDLVFEFVAERLPDQLWKVREIFSRRGAYGRFKDLLEWQGQLDAWYEYEQAATQKALLDWAEEEGMNVVPGRRATGT